MSMLKRFGILVAACAILGGTAELLNVPKISGFVSSAEARVGRPLTPVSVAGVARRTTRRCAVGVYDC
jgi:hypothetical protein